MQEHAGVHGRNFPSAYFKFLICLSYVDFDLLFG